MQGEKNFPLGQGLLHYGVDYQPTDATVIFPHGFCYIKRFLLDINVIENLGKNLIQQLNDQYFNSDVS